MHTEILTSNQVDLLPFISNFKRSFYMVGGTAIALHIGHRQSIDFDLFTMSKLNKLRIKSTLLKIPFHQIPIFEDYDQLHLVINDVKLTFCSYPYPVPHPLLVGKHISIPSLLSLAAMKAFALGRKAKWKDYVDLYFILKDYFTLQEICKEAVGIFNQQFSEKLFREQLAFHKDIDYTEPVQYVAKQVGESEIKEFLVEKAIELNF